MKQTSAMRQEIKHFRPGKNMKINIGHEARNYKHLRRKIDETNIGHEARNYKHLRPEKKNMKQTSAMRQEITNISCRKIHETNIGHEARNYKHLMPEST